jgi:prepilin-type N-terminal cleavage/methylation domain-containing protein
MRANRPASAGFTLVELSIVLFILGLILWTVTPRLARLGATGREAAFRAFSADSEAAFDASLFEKKEWRLLIDPRNGSYRFFSPGSGREPADPRNFGTGVSVTGITVEGEDRSLEGVTEVRYLPGGRMADTLIRLRDSSNENAPSDWTLRLDPTSGSVDVLEGTFSGNA